MHAVCNSQGLGSGFGCQIRIRSGSDIQIQNLLKIEYIGLFNYQIYNVYNANITLFYIDILFQDPVFKGLGRDPVFITVGSESVFSRGLDPDGIDPDLG